MDKDSADYTVSIDQISKIEWEQLLLEFDDATIYQTWSYGAVCWGQSNLSHIVIKHKNEIIAAAQLRIIKIPFINAGIAYVRWGPLWKRCDIDNNLEDLHHIIKAMRREYVERRGLLLRIIPNEIEQSNNKIQSIIESAGLKWIDKDDRTLYLYLGQSFDNIRNNMSKSWRKNLNKAEKRELTVIEGSGMDLFDIVDRLFRETVSRKNFDPGINIDAYRALQESLPANMKMQIMICKSEGQPIAGLIGSAIGDIGIELVAATGNDGIELGGSYLLRWKMLEYLKGCGCHFYNLNGINPEKNPGGYQFKTGFSGKNGQDVYFIGNFEACENKISALAIKCGNALFSNYKKGKAVIDRLRNSLFTGIKNAK
jgi:lipid II:glycine glycyltransferase (peptidoglycan interpeptide bridge formation enzyme)